MKKKCVALLLSTAMVVSLTACGGGSDAPATDEAPAESMLPERSHLILHQRLPMIHW